MRRIFILKDNWDPFDPWMALTSCWEIFYRVLIPILKNKNRNTAISEIKLFRFFPDVYLHSDTDKVNYYSWTNIWLFWSHFYNLPEFLIAELSVSINLIITECQCQSVYFRWFDKQKGIVKILPTISLLVKTITGKQWSCLIKHELA